MRDLAPPNAPLPRVSDAASHRLTAVEGIDLRDDPGVIVTVKSLAIGQSKAQEQRLALFLSPAGAARLSRLLAEAVQEYLDPEADR